MPVGVGEDIVHAEHTRHGGDDAQQIPVGPVGRQEYIQEEDHRHIGGIPMLVDIPQEQAQQHRRQIQAERNSQILRRVGQALADGGSLPLFMAAELLPIGVHIHSPLLYKYAAIVTHFCVKKALKSR